jgi:hypothetical protein
MIILSDPLPRVLVLTFSIFAFTQMLYRNCYYQIGLQGFIATALVRDEHLSTVRPFAPLSNLDHY